MGMQTVIFKCPKCEKSMGEQLGPNWTVVPGPVATVIVSCPWCQAVLGTYGLPPSQ